MPKPTKLHDKGRPISIQKAPTNGKSEGFTEPDPETAVRQFQLELCWCIQQLERTLTSKKGTDKKMQETWKTLQVLKNNNQPMVRKRQLMRTYFGDYRAKMLAEERKLVKMASKMKISDKPVKPKATFLRKSVFQTTGDSAFRFNFNLTPEEVDKGSPQAANNNSDGSTGSPDAGNTECPSSGNTGSPNTGNTVTDAGDGNTKNIHVAEDSRNTFKFRFTDSEFRFNFDVGKNDNLS